MSLGRHKAIRIGKDRVPLGRDKGLGMMGGRRFWNSPAPTGPTGTQSLGGASGGYWTAVDSFENIELILQYSQY